MSVLPIYTYGSSILRKKAAGVREASDEVLRLAIDMFETLHRAGGIGLAATQVGSLHRMFVLDVSSVDGYEDARPLTVLNPEIVRSEGSWTMEEGCLSIPELRDEVARAERVTLRYRDASFAQQEIELEGIPARVVLHEIDHLDGVLFIDRLPQDRAGIHAERLRQIEKGDFEVDYPVVTASNQMV